jgi:indoleacetamide hydrolase
MGHRRTLQRLTATAVAGCLLAASATAEDARLRAIDLIDDIRDGETSAEAAVSAALEAIEAWAVLNGVAHLNAEAATRAAREVDEGTRSGPLAGLPIVVKDNIRAEGLPNAAGTPALQEAVADDNAPVLQRLVDAGAILVATTNMHELAFGISGWNPTYQTGPEPGVRNPYDTTRFAGGSSSGTGALVGAGAVAAGLGTDTGGSVRVPAAVNGVSGLRPTIGRYPAEGIVPISNTRDTAGIIAASVADIELIDRVITGDAAVEAADLAGVTLGVGSAFAADLDADVGSVWASVLDELEAAGATIVEVDDSAIFELNAGIAFPIALTEARPHLVAYLERYMPGIAIEDVVAGIASPDVKAAYEGLVLPGRLPGPDGDLVDGAPIYERAMAEGRPALIAAYEEVFAENGLDALIFPAVPQVAEEASPESSSLEIFTRFIRNADPGSVAGLPGLVVAAGLGPETGLPVGIELDGPAGSDRQLIALGLAIEELLGRTGPPEAP